MRRSRRCDFGRARKHFIHAVSLQFTDTIGRIDLHATQELTPQRGAGIDETYRLIVAGTPQCIQKLYAGHACSVNEHTLHTARQPKCTRARDLQENSGRLPAAQDQERRQHRVEQHDGAGNAVRAGKQEQQTPIKGRKPDGRDHHSSAALVRVAGNGPVETELEEGGNPDKGRGAQQQDFKRRRRNKWLAEAQRHGEP